MSRKKPQDPNFPGQPPIARLHRPWLATEKINGSNGLIAVKALDDPMVDGWPGNPLGMLDLEISEGETVRHGVWAGSKNQWLGPDGDNFGFGAWVKGNFYSLAKTLGPGLHRGEWWGSGIQTGYGLPKGEKRFSLFNVSRWTMESTWLTGSGYLPEASGIPDHAVPGLGVVPLLAQNEDGHSLNAMVHRLLDELEQNGSVAAPGFMRAEGVVVFQPSSQIAFKATIHNDEIPKGLIRSGN